MGRHCVRMSLLLVLVAALLVAASPYQHFPGGFDMETSGDGSGMLDGSGGSGDLAGSGDGSGDPEPSCKRPAARIPPPANREEKLLTEIRCHLACVQRVIRQQGTPLQSSTDYPPWPNIPDSVLERDCSTYQGVQECRMGCVLHSKSADMNITRCSQECSRGCVTACNNKRSCDQSDSVCLRNCSVGWCEEGCEAYEQEIFPDGSGQPPSAPVASPVFRVPAQGRTAGLYQVDARNTTPSDIDLGLTQPAVTSFIFRVIQVELQLFAYYWLHSFEDVLNLGALACEEVIIQFAAVNKHGLSSYSPSTSLFVYGESAPLVPENPSDSSIHIEVSPDDRFNYWKHANIRVSWEKPARGFQYLSHYVVVMYPHVLTECGRMGREIIVHKESTSATIRAQTPTEGPVNGCRYRISVYSQPLNGEPMWPFPVIPILVNVTNPVPLQFTCTRSWDGLLGAFQFTVSWVLPNSTILREAIREFSTIVKLVPLETEGERQSLIRDVGITRFNSKEAKLAYNHTTTPVSYNNSGFYYVIELKTRAMSYSDQILIPDIQTCVFDAEALPPEPISTVNIISEDFGVPDAANEAELEVVVSWDASVGNIESYQIRVVQEFLSNEDADVIDQQSFSAMQSQAFVRAHVPVVTSDGCIYLQIRSISTFNAISNWSNPVCISVVREFPTSPSFFPSPSVTPTGTTTKGLPRDILYVVIALGGLLLVAMVILILFVFLACVQNKKASRRSAILKQQLNIPKKQSMPPPKAHFQGRNPYPLACADEWELSPSNVIIEARLGEGMFGEVYRGRVQGVKDTGPKTVAIKLLKAMASQKDRQNFMHYIHQSKMVSHGAHPNIVNMVGCVTLHEPVCLTSHYPAGGTLLAFLEKSRKELVKMKTLGERPVPHLDSACPTLDPSSPDTDSIPGGLESADLISFATQIASGMEYLATLGLVHGDLACRNVYMEAGHKTVRISDFSLSPSEGKGGGEDDVYLNTMTGCLPVRWMAIESIAGGEFTITSDVWAFGITLWEIVTIGGFPYPNISSKDILAALKKNHRLECPDNCSQELYGIMVQCWDGSPAKRPTFSRLHQTLQDLLSTAQTDQLVKLEIDERKPYYNMKGGKSNHRKKVHRSIGTNTAPNERFTSVVVEGRQNIPAGGPLNVTNPYTDSLLPKIEEEEREEEQREEEQENSGFELEMSSVSECSEDPQTSSTTASKQDTNSSDETMEL